MCFLCNIIVFINNLEDTNSKLFLYAKFILVSKKFGVHSSSSSHLAIHFPLQSLKAKFDGIEAILHHLSLSLFNFLYLMPSSLKSR